MEISACGFANFSAMLKNFSDNFNKIHQQILVNFSEQLMNETDFNSKIDFACYCLKCEIKIVFLFSTKVQKKVSSHSKDQLFTRFFAGIKTPLTLHSLCIPQGGAGR